MSWLSEKLSVLKLLSFYGFLGWILGKFFLGLGLGLLIAGYFQNDYWIPLGWVFIILCVVLSIPAIKAMLE